ncbi:MAG TPA: ATP-binding protein [Candidatus Atribacteria bacterium]|nr:ATP-binding protein [Candidatus Atribacteria bacterium]
MKPELIGFVHFDRPGSKNNQIEVLVAKEKASFFLRNKFIKIVNSFGGDKHFIGRIVEGPFFQPEEVSRDSALAQVSILHGEEFPAPPNFYATFIIEVIGELDGTRIISSGSRPSPQSKVLTLNDDELYSILGLEEGDMVIGNLEGYPNICIKFNSKKISVIPRNLGIFGTVGSGKTNTAQVLIEELANQQWAVLVLDIEGEYTMMNKPNDNPHEIEKLKRFGLTPSGLKDFNVLKLCNQESTVETAEEVTIKIDQIDPYVLAEILNTTEPQTAALMAIIDILKRKNKDLKQELDEEENVLTPGKKTKSMYTLDNIIETIDEHKSNPEKLGVRRGSLQPLRRKLISLRRSRAFDDPTAVSIRPDVLLKPGKVTVFDLSYTPDYEKNLLTAQLLSRIFEAKKKDKTRSLPKTAIFIEEAHTFVSRENKDKMFETIRMLKEIARRGRKRWLALCFISQQPSHLPNEIFELANTRIIHNIRSSKNLDVLRLSSGGVTEEMWNCVPTLDVGHAIINGPQFKNSLIAQIRFCKTKRVRQEDIE